MKHKILQYEMVSVNDVRGLNLNSTDRLVMILIVSLTVKTDKCIVLMFFAEQLELKKMTISKSIKIKTIKKWKGMNVVCYIDLNKK